MKPQTNNPELNEPLNVTLATETKASTQQNELAKQTSEANAKSSKFVTTIAICTVLIFGTANTFILRYQDEFGFKHPVFQSALILMGQFLNYITFIAPIMGQKARAKHFDSLLDSCSDGGKNPYFPFLWMALSASFDVIGSICATGALFLVEPSVYQMLRGGVIVGCCVLSKCFLGNPIYRHHALGVIFALVGFFFVGLASMLTSGLGDYTAGQTIIGIVLIIVGIVFTSSQFVTQEYVLRKYTASPARLVGLEGVFGVPVAVIVTYIISSVPCLDPKICNIGGP